MFSVFDEHFDVLKEVFEIGQSFLHFQLILQGDLRIPAVICVEIDRHRVSTK